MKLTDTKLAGLKLGRGETDKIFFDDQIPGFGLRLREGGSRKFVLHYRIGGKQRRYTIGTPSTALTVQVARQRANKALLDVADGKDPAAQKATAKAEAKNSFKSVADDYIEFLKRRMAAGDLRPRSYAEIERHLLKHFKPLHPLVIGSVTRATVAARLREIAKKNGTGAADRTRSNVSTFFSWAIGEGICETNPIDGTNKHREYVERERSLIEVKQGRPPNYDDLIAVWKGAPDNEFGKIVRLLILTLCRREEIGSLGKNQPSDVRDAEIARLVAAAVNAGEKIEYGIALAMARYGVSERTATRAWKARRPVWVTKDDSECQNLA